MGDKTNVIVIVAAILLILFLFGGGLAVFGSDFWNRLFNKGGNPPPSGSYWTLDLTSWAGSASVTNIPLGNHTYTLNQSVFVYITKLKVQQNPAYPEEAWLQWIRFRLNGNYQTYGQQNITVGPAGNRSIIYLEAIFTAEQAVFYPAATFARGQTYTVSLFFVNQYEGFHAAYIELSPDPYSRAVFSAAVIGTDYSLGAATGFENCWNAYTPAGLKYIKGVGSSDDYTFGSICEWKVQVTVSSNAIVGADRVMVAMWGLGDVSNAFCGFNNYEWFITVT
jgi:hypothetical protein